MIHSIRSCFCDSCVGIATERSPFYNILKPHRGGFVVEVARLRLPAFTVEIKELAEWFGLELARIVVDEY